MLDANNSNDQCRVCKDFWLPHEIFDKPAQSSEKGICGNCLLKEYRKLLNASKKHKS